MPGGAAGAAAYDWSSDPPPVLLICGFALLAVLGALVTVLLNRSFVRAG